MNLYNVSILAQKSMVVTELTDLQQKLDDMKQTCEYCYCMPCCVLGSLATELGKLS